MKQIRNGGFTLVELIVVVLILGVLSAIAIPSLTGYIDTAKTESTTIECRQAVTAAQSLAAERLAANKPVPDGTLDTTDTLYAEAAQLSETQNLGTINSMVFAGSVLTELEYTNEVATVVYKVGEYSIKT